MKKFILVIVSLSFSSLSSFSQNLIAVQNNNTPQFFSDANEAFDAAVEGDTLYFPAGTFSLNQTIDKTLHIVGVGHNTNSTAATGSTVFSGASQQLPQLIYVSGGGGTVTGISFSSVSASALANIRVDSNIGNLLVDRVYISGRIMFYTGIAENIFILRSIIGTLDLRTQNSNEPSGLISNNILLGRPHYVNNIQIDSNNFLSTPSTGFPVLYANGSSVVNNIFLTFQSNITSSSSNSIFRNNFGLTIAGNSGSNFGSNNLFDSSIDENNIFVNYINSSSVVSYNYDMNFPEGSPLLTSGTSGGQIGIYGGRFPWKDGSIPFNPHIVSKNISGTTDENGNLQVQIEVQAQGN
ncbi:hypothetical protein DFQ05_1012 [Winogradskyella wandonensis]|uniref:Pectate lyase-like protein n=1 Tax=Winogradskyella wandonensis TaxID=1442586 RepID=A0A4R1KSJ0_9FLAO|nr:hypothetical protein [Winogradskyella wandonensis]TCK67239.1 hypothetical protein DFQ05_1012 [Winogradskyella wandonensis]